MIIGITGHTSGIGKATANWFASRGHTIKGYSRTTGYNILGDIPIIIKDIMAMNIDIFINNAYCEMQQVRLLYMLHNIWKDDNTKTIINISSNSSDGIKNFVHPYAIYKAALDDAVAQLQNTKPACRIMNLKPGYVDTPMVTGITLQKMDADYIAEVIGWMIEQPNLIKTLTVVP